MVRLGSAFDIVGERKQTDFNANYDGARDHRIVRDQAAEPQERSGQGDRQGKPVSLDKLGNHHSVATSIEKQDFRTIHIPVQVPPDGEKTVTYTVKYTW